MTRAESDVEKLLREVSVRLDEGREQLPDGARIESFEAPDLARSVRDVLTALHGVLRTIDLESIPSNSSAQSIVAVSQHLEAAAELARRAGDPGRTNWRHLPQDYSSVPTPRTA